MRKLVGLVLLICAACCQAQSPEAQVLAVYGQLARAVQSGDADHTFVGLWSRAKAPEAEKMRAQMQPQPDAHYTSSRVFVQGNEAVLLGQYAQDGYLSVRFVREDGHWKIQDFEGNDRPYAAESVYAMLPPPPGAFGRAGEPWQTVAPALDQATASRQGWQLRAACDDSYLYLRIDVPTGMPAPGTAAEKPPMGWPVMKVDVSGVGEFVLHTTAEIGDQATFDASGHANSHRHYVDYWLMLERGNKVIFQAWSGLEPSQLIRAGGNSLEVRVPVRTMDVAEANSAKFVIGDAAWPRSAIFTAAAQRFR